MKTIKKGKLKYRIVPQHCNGDKYYTLQYYGEERIITKRILCFPTETKLVKGWYDVEVDVGSVDFCLMTPKRFKSAEAAKKWILK